MITKAYSEYFQKSKVFLFPLLGLPKNATFIPECTYLSWKGVYTPRDRKLIIIYNCDDSPEWHDFAEKLRKRTFFSNLQYGLDATVCVVVMDMNSFEKTYLSVLQGKYSQISVDHQSICMTYFGMKSGEWAYVETYFKPDKYRKLYAGLYGVEESTLKGELCSMPDAEKECLKLITNLNNVEVTS